MSRSNVSINIGGELPLFALRRLHLAAHEDGVDFDWNEREALEFRECANDGASVLLTRSDTRSDLGAMKEACRELGLSYAYHDDGAGGDGAGAALAASRLAITSAGGAVRHVERRFTAGSSL